MESIGPQGQKTVCPRADDVFPDVAKSGEEKQNQMWGILRIFAICLTSYRAAVATQGIFVPRLTIC